MNKVISREYVEKNYIKKDDMYEKIENYINKNMEDQNNCLKIIQDNKSLKSAYERVYTEIEGEIKAYKNILELLRD